jgi:hypothetical protein
MKMSIPDCPVCRVRMEEGYVLDAHQNTFARVSWIEGQPEKSLLTGFKTKGKRKIPTVTFRCPQCGWMVWFAPETD